MCFEWQTAVDVRVVKPVTDEQVFYDKFSYDKFYFTGVRLSTSLL